MKRLLRSCLMLAVCALLVLSVSPTLAQLAPKIIVTPNWGPALQLTTLDTNAPPYPTWNNGDDYRYVTAFLDTTTTVEFWAVEMNCTANGNVLDTYVWDETSNATPEDWADNRRPVEWNGSIWGGQDGWTEFMPTYSNVGGVLKISAVISKRGRNLPLGRNGVQTGMMLGTIQFRAKPTAGTSPLACTFSFLDRNGKVVVPATYTAPAPVTIISGYSITGTASYQTRTVKNNIGVQCYWNGNPGDLVTPNPVMTNAAGQFTIGNLRRWDHVDCVLYGNLTNTSPAREPDLYLSSRFSFNLGEHGSYRELPIELRAGNLNRNDCDPGWPGDWQCINDDDLVTLTGAWNTPGGDVNGDGKTDKSDLAIVAGNTRYGEDVDGSHILYSLARGWAANGRDSRIWLGGRETGAVTQQVPGAANTADFWATLSPDGQTIAFVRKTMVANQPARYELFTAPAAGGAPKLLLSKAAAGNMDAFAPSWEPNGASLVFVCANSGTAGVPESGYLYNAGNLCIVTAGGKHFRQLTGAGILGGPNIAKIFPPAWADGWIMFGGTGNAGNGCAGTLCYYDWNSVFRVDNDIPSPPSGISDMPLMVNGRVFYRFTDPSGNSSLRFIDGLDWNCTGGPDEPCNPDIVKAYTPYVGRGCPSTTNARPQFAHSSVVFDSNPDENDCAYDLLDWNEAVGAPYDVGYYEIAPYGFEIILKNSSDGLNYRHTWYRWELGLEDTNPGSGCADGNVAADSDRCWPEWQEMMYLPPDYWRIDEYQIGSQVSDDWWDGNPATPTLLHAERGTMDWQP